jgi:hypothetical protein
MLAEFSPPLFRFSSRAGRETKPATANSRVKRDPSADGSDGIEIKGSRDGSQMYDPTVVKGKSRRSQEISQDKIDRQRTEGLAKAKFEKSQEILPQDYKVNSKLESHRGFSGKFSLANFRKAFARPIMPRPEESERLRKGVASQKNVDSSRTWRTLAQNSNRETRSAQDVGGYGHSNIRNFALERAAKATYTPGSI